MARLGESRQWGRRRGKGQKGWCWLDMAIGQEGRRGHKAGRYGEEVIGPGETD